jgi:hypothetical protein
MPSTRGTCRYLPRCAPRHGSSSPVSSSICIPAKRLCNPLQSRTAFQALRDRKASSFAGHCLGTLIAKWDGARRAKSHPPGSAVAPGSSASPRQLPFLFRPSPCERGGSAPRSRGRKAHCLQNRVGLGLTQVPSGQIRPVRHSVDRLQLDETSTGAVVGWQLRPAVFDPWQMNPSWHSLLREQVLPSPSGARQVFEFIEPRQRRPV